MIAPPEQVFRLALTHGQANISLPSTLMLADMAKLRAVLRLAGMDSTREAQVAEHCHVEAPPRTTSFAGEGDS